MTTNTTIAFVAGAWHSPACYERVAEYTEAAGFSSRYIGPLPSVGQAIPDPDEDRKFIREALLDELDNEKRNVVLVVHSYGGIPGSNACAGLAKQDRKDKETAVVGTVYICSFAIQSGMTLTDAVGGQDPPWYRVKGDTVMPDSPKAMFYNGCSQEDQDANEAALVPQSYNSFYHKSSNEVWKHIPSTYLICELDQAMPPFAQRLYIERAGTFKYTESIQAGHSPFLSKPKETADFLIKSAKEYFL